MSGYINSFLIEPVVRQARRWSFADAEAAEGDDDAVKQDQATPALAMPRDTVDSQDSWFAYSPLRMERFRHGRSGLFNVQRSYTDYPNVQTHDASADVLPPSDDATPAAPFVEDARQVDQMEFEPLTDTRLVASPPPVESSILPSNQETGMEVEQRGTIESMGAMSLDDTAGAAIRPSNEARHQLAAGSDVSMSSRPSASSLDSVRRGAGPTSLSREDHQDGSHMEEVLPEDDGMKSLRAKLQTIRDMALSSEEKAKRMHALMTADFETLRARHGGLASQQRRTGTGSSQRRASKSGPPISEGQYPQGFYSISQRDLEPTYRPPSPVIDGSSTPHSRRSSESHEAEVTLGCKHYKRNVKIQCFTCRRWYTCRVCHDEAEAHTLDRKLTQNMLCMLCWYPQPAGEYCIKCGELTAAYYCDICKLWDNDSRHSIYHCDDCGICRRGQGLGKDYVHCKTCNVCISIAWASTHRCVERATECDCPICGDYMFTSSESVVAMKCGHYIHRRCYDEYMETSYKCPICGRSAVNMELQWRKLDLEVQAQPMPEKYSDTKAWVSCNDCSGRCVTRYHWVGNKCTFCDSYNTNLMRLVNPPEERTAAEERAVQLGGGTSVPASDQPGETAHMLSPPSSRRTSDQNGSESDSGMSDAIARSAEETSLSPEDALAEPAHYLGPGTDSLPTTALSYELLHAPHSPSTVASSTAVGSPPSPIHFPSPPSSGGGERSRGATDGHADGTEQRADEAEDEDDEDDDDVAFWGAGISPPAGWSISPPAWASPSFFATRWVTAGEEDVDIEDDDDDMDGEESMEEVEDDSDEDEVMGWDEEDEGEDEMELIGHR